MGSIVEQLHYYVRAEPYNGSYVSNAHFEFKQIVFRIKQVFHSYFPKYALKFQNTEDYLATLKECIDECKNTIVILIDSVDDIITLDDWSWLPTKLSEHVKLIITTRSAVGGIDSIDDCDTILCHFKNNRIPNENFVPLNEDEDSMEEKVSQFRPFQLVRMPFVEITNFQLKKRQS